VEGEKFKVWNFSLLRERYLDEWIVIKKCHAGKFLGVSASEMLQFTYRMSIKKIHNYYVYILTNKRNGTLYVGVTNGLQKRTFQHRLKEQEKSFTTKYNIDKLVYFENHRYILDAISREKQIKKWKRERKMNLIEKTNPTWRDFFQDM